MSGVGLATPLLAQASHRWEPWLVGPGAFPVVLAGVAFAASAALAVWSGRSARWTVADDASWTLSLAAFACLGALGAAPVTVGMALHGIAMLLLAVRVPPVRMLAVSGFTVLLGTLVRTAAGHGAGAVLAYALVSTMMLVAHGLLARATHSLALVLAEREALLNDRRERTPRHRERTSSGSTSSVRPSRGSSEERAMDGAASSDDGWEGLVDRLRSSLTTLCDDAGVAATVHAELRGLAPPSHKMRNGVIKLTQEAAHHALRETDPRSIAVTLKRADGGLVLEVADDGCVDDGVRKRRALASIRGRVAALGGSAEVKRADVGWVMRVRLPCEQLN